MPDFRSFDKYTQGALVAGVVAFILSFFSSYVTVSVDGGKEALGLGFSAGTSAWHSYATLGILLVIAATALIAVKAFAPQVLPDTVPWQLTAAAAAGLGTLLLILRAFTVSDSGLGGLVSVGPGWSGYVLFLAGIVLTVCCALAARAAGEKLPEMKAGSTGA